MPKLALEIKATLENLVELSTDGDDYRYYIKVKCTKCNESCTEWEYVTVEGRVEMPDSRGTASMVRKCKLCGSRGTIDLHADSRASYKGGDEASGTFQRIIVMECRGVEPTDFDFRMGWKAVAESGEVFEVDLSDKIFADYDERSQLPMEVNDVEARFVHAK